MGPVATESLPDTLKSIWARAIFFSLAGIVVVTAAAVLFFSVTRPPTEFPIGKRVEIPLDTPLTESVRILKERQVVRSALFLQLLLVARVREGGVKAGTYQFDQPLSLFEVAKAITSGTHLAPLIQITIPEGLRTMEIDTLISGALVNIEPGAFKEAATGAEGYLFPETYHVPETFTAQKMVALMKDTYAETIAPLGESFAASSRRQEEIIIMASILEREANSEESMKLVSGILWKRFDKGMPLQVDASFAYLLGKKSEEVTADDLEIDSPYNTYKYKGLPPTPINNPGLVAIKAALGPTESSYLYYLTAPDGTFHYAETFEEHKKNKARFLGKI